MCTALKWLQELAQPENREHLRLLDNKFGTAKDSAPSTFEGFAKIYESADVIVDTPIHYPGVKMTEDGFTAPEFTGNNFAAINSMFGMCFWKTYSGETTHEMTVHEIQAKIAQFRKSMSPGTLYALSWFSS
jgi:hypothetical protein